MAGIEFRRGNVRGLKFSPPLGISKLRLHCPADTPKFRQGKSSPLSLDMKFSRESIPSQTPPPPVHTLAVPCKWLDFRDGGVAEVGFGWGGAVVGVSPGGG